MNYFLNKYRALPYFRGKFRIGKFLFRGHLNRPDPVEFQAHYNIQYKIPNTIENLSSELLINGIYENEIVNFIAAILPNGGVFFDVGANIGAIGLPVLKKGKNISYFAFEPTPSTFASLKYNLECNNIINCTIIQALIHAGDNKQFKFYCGDKNGKNSLAPSYSSDYIEIPSLSLDSFCEKNDIQFIDLIKIDVQGFEMYVFQGMKRLLMEKRVKNILFEFEEWAEKDAALEIGSSQKEIVGSGYELFDLKGEKIKELVTDGTHMFWAKPGLNRQGKII